MEGCWVVGAKMSFQRKRRVAVSIFNIDWYFHSLSLRYYYYKHTILNLTDDSSEPHKKDPIREIPKTPSISFLIHPVFQGHLCHCNWSPPTHHPTFSKLGRVNSVMNPFPRPKKKTPPAGKKKKRLTGKTRQEEESSGCVPAFNSDESAGAVEEDLGLTEKGGTTSSSSSSSPISEEKSKRSSMKAKEDSIFVCVFFFFFFFFFLERESQFCRERKRFCCCESIIIVDTMASWGFLGVVGGKRTRGCKFFLSFLFFLKKKLITINIFFIFILITYRMGNSGVWMSVELRKRGGFWLWLIRDEDQLVLGVLGPSVSWQIPIGSTPYLAWIKVWGYRKGE